MSVGFNTLLKLRKTPRGIYSVVKKFASQIIDFSIVENNYTDAIEKEILLSAFVLDFNPNKDMRSNFILDYIKNIENNFFSYNTPKDVLSYFVNSGCGVCFKSEDDANEAKETLHEYILSRLILYRKIINELHCGNTARFDCLYYAIYHWSFSVFRYSEDKDIDYLKDDIIYSNHTLGETYRKYKELLPMLDKSYYNRVKVPKDTWLTNYPESEEFNTEGKLPYLKLEKGRFYTSFSSASGKGIFKCRDCGYTQQLLAFLHGCMDATIGRQCPQCGEFCTEENHSKQYHCFGPSEEDLVCPKCGYTIRKKEESIFKGNSNPLFCPKCESTNIVYRTMIIT